MLRQRMIKLEEMIESRARTKKSPEDMEPALRVRLMREQELKNLQAGLKCRYMLNRTLQQQIKSSTERK